MTFAALALNFVPAFELAGSALLSLALLWVISVAIVARMRLRPPRMTDGKALYRLKRVSPADLDLPYENQSFELTCPRAGKLTLRGWWLPAPAGSSRTVVLLHGYADAKVGALAWAPFLHAAGYNLALYDARAHGESDGQYCTAGYFERHDLIEDVRQLRETRPAATRKLAVFGISMGGVTTLCAGALGLEADALIVDSVFGDYWSAGVLHAALFGLPGRSIMQSATWYAQYLCGARFNEIRPLDLISRQAKPVLLIQPEDDRVISPADAAQLRTRLLQSPVAAASQSLLIPSATHVTGLATAPQLYQKTVLEFLAARLG